MLVVPTEKLLKLSLRGRELSGLDVCRQDDGDGGQKALYLSAPHRADAALGVGEALHDGDQLLGQADGLLEASINALGLLEIRFSGVFGRLTPAGGLFYRTQSCGRARE